MKKTMSSRWRAGLGQPFKVPQQYVNFVGKEVEVLDADGKKFRGVLKAVDGRNFTVTVREKVKKEGSKRPVLTDVDHDFSMGSVKYTKYLISSGEQRGPWRRYVHEPKAALPP